MDNRDIREACEALGYGDRVPERLEAIISEFLRRKSVFRPATIEPSDFVFCTFIYDITGKGVKKNG